MLANGRGPCLQSEPLSQFPPSYSVIFFLVTCVNIFSAKNRTSEWKLLTSFFFFAGMGGIIFQIEKRAERLWIKTLGYDRADAILLSKYQSFALVELILGCPTLLLLLGNSVSRQ